MAAVCHSLAATANKAQATRITHAAKTGSPASHRLKSSFVMIVLRPHLRARSRPERISSRILSFESPTASLASLIEKASRSERGGLRIWSMRLPTWLGWTIASLLSDYLARRPKNSLCQPPDWLHPLLQAHNILERCASNAAEPLYLGSPGGESFSFFCFVVVEVVMSASHALINVVGYTVHNEPRYAKARHTSDG